MESKQSDQISELLGTCGKWQAVLLIVLGMFHISTSWQVLVTSFLTIEPEFVCTPKALNKSSMDALAIDFDGWLNLSGQYLSNESLPKCTTPYFDFSKGFEMSDEPCGHWTYNDSFYSETIVSKFDLVCKNDVLLTLNQMIYMLGVLVGSLLSGILSDRFGRRTVILWTSLGTAGFGSLTAFSTHIVIFIALRFFTALCTIANFTSCFVYCMELVGGQWRTVVGIGLEFPWAFAYSILPLMAYNYPHWSTLQLMISLPCLLSFVMAYFIPESPRWLLAEDRVEEATQVLEKALHFNGEKWPQHLRLQSTRRASSLTAASGVEARRESIVDLFKTPNMRRKALVQFYLWFTASFVYYGLTLNSGQLIPGDIYVNFTVSGVIEFPAYTLSLIMLLFLGRRLPLALTYLTGGIFLLITIISPQGVGVLVVSSVGKFGVICAFGIIYVYTAELYPTVVRNTGLGSSSMCARFGSILAPVAARELPKILLATHIEESVAKWSPIILFAITALLAALLTLILPETHGRPLPDALEEAEEFGKGEKFRLFDVQLSSLFPHKSTAG